jgi:hypothetical protein
MGKSEMLEVNRLFENCAILGRQMLSLIRSSGYTWLTVTLHLTHPKDGGDHDPSENCSCRPIRYEWVDPTKDSLATHVVYFHLHRIYCGAWWWENMRAVSLPASAPAPAQECEYEAHGCWRY